jgi:hypothetical protein
VWQFSIWISFRHGHAPTGKIFIVNKIFFFLLRFLRSANPSLTTAETVFKNSQHYCPWDSDKNPTAVHHDKNTLLF